ncbi:MAG: hypothetical protein COA45_00040 [Zetaproteobacteria bacterium]|nr:MAG: hypothetical protein COA45_00040 [Zetaproteobacteria bacterium]
MGVLQFRLWCINTREMSKITNFSVLKDVSDPNIIIMQNTGMQDKNQRPIFENDICCGKINIVCVSKEVTGHVIYNTKNARYELKDNESSVPLCMGIDLDIIGNIYENEELLATDINDKVTST